MNDFVWQLGYDAYKQGNKVPRWPAKDFVTGWWAAHDKGERFGEYDSFLQAPD